MYVRSSIINSPGQSSFFRVFFLFCIAALISAPPVRADAGGVDRDAAPAYAPDDFVFIPHIYGKTIYRCNEESPNQIYIIGMGHRDSLTRELGDSTVMSQMEVYRIAEWLIKHQGPELLLPEGFFLKSTDAAASHDMPGRESPSVPLDSATLMHRLQDTVEYVNAEMLLMQNQGVQARQVEDSDLYQAVQREIILLEKSGHDAYAYFFEKAKLDYLQELRTAAMLQRIPDIVNKEFGNGRISERKAIFTIGLSHVSEIIKYLEESRIEIYSPAFVSSLDDYRADVNLLKEGYGVTIIIPRSLAESRRILRLTRLDHVI